jgi:uncharacterized membrane protein YhaH (DUF805 family)
MNSLWQSFRDYFQLLFGFSGRINRAKYWLAVFTFPIAMWALLAVVWGFEEWAIGVRSGRDAIGFAWVVVGTIAAIITTVAVGIKRLHDRDMSGRWLVVFQALPFVLTAISMVINPNFLQLVSASVALELASGALSLAGSVLYIWGLVVLGFLRGTVGPNQYGPDPLATAIGSSSAANGELG